MKVSGEWLERQTTQDVMATLTSAGYQAFVVGGCVRNALIGASITDIDIATDARPETVMNLAQSAGMNAVPTGVEFGTVTIVHDGLAHEITTFRSDVETDGRHAVVSFSLDVKDDARRRDFTMNALYADAAGNLLDPLGGLADLRARRFRFIDDAEQRIKEDYLRILRFFRFHAWYGDPSAGLDPDALAAISVNLDGLSRLSKERVGGEIRKLLAAPDPAPAVAAMRQTGVLTQILEGASDKSLAPVVHLERSIGVAPDAIRRLAILGMFEATNALRLSKKESRELALLRDLIGASTGICEVAYRYGKQMALSTALLRAAVFEAPLDAGIVAKIEHSAAAVFPVSAADLGQKFEGVALGQKLRQLEQRWIESDFKETKSDLLR